MPTADDRPRCRRHHRDGVDGLIGRRLIPAGMGCGIARRREIAAQRDRELRASEEIRVLEEK